MRARVWLLGIVLAGLLAAPPARAASYVRIELTGTINPVRARYVQRALEQARMERAAFVLVTIDTPGGLVESMERIAGSFVNSPVPVVGYVEPRGAQATSAGASILLATDVAAMAPGTRVGAAHPVGAGKDLEGAVKEKATNSMVALAKSLAERRGRSQEFAEQIVRQSSSFTAGEARGRGGIEIVADHRAALLSALDGRNVELGKRTLTLRTRGIRERTIGLSFAERILDVAADPTLASLLISIGVLGILYELASRLYAQTTLRNIMGQHELDEILGEREKIGQALQRIIDEATDAWGIKVSAVEIKDIELPEVMRRAMARQAEAERERRAKIIAAEGELQASQKLLEAALVLDRSPAALQLRYLQTLVEVGVQNSTTLVFPLPLELTTPFRELWSKRAAAG